MKTPYIKYNYHSFFQETKNVNKQKMACSDDGDSYIKRMSIIIMQCL